MTTGVILNVVYGTLITIAYGWAILSKLEKLNEKVDKLASQNRSSRK